MRKFRLIKNYPGSPNIGTIVELSRYKGCFRYYSTPDGNLLERDIIKNNPEFWTEYLFTTEDGVDIYEGDKSCAIYDIITPQSLTMEDYNGISESLIYFSSIKAAKEYLSKLKPYYKSREGLNLYLGDRYYEVYIPDGTIKPTTICDGDEEATNWAIFAYEDNAKEFSNNIKDGMMMHGVLAKGTWETKNREKLYTKSTNFSWKWFDTEEERDEYIKMNKPQFSRQDIINMLEKIRKE